MSGLVADQLRRWATTLDSIVYPRWCAICRRPSERVGLCPDCSAELAGRGIVRCRRCGQVLHGPAAFSLAAREAVGCGLCRDRKPRFDAVAALGSYEGPLRYLCLRLKHASWAWLAPVLVDRLLESEGDRVRDWLKEGPGAVVMGVPLHWRRRWLRTYNQAEALARGLARRLGLVRTRPLRRVVATPPLYSLGRAERTARLRGAFGIRPRSVEAIRGRDVLLVDDILTTGATCNAAARELKRAGARRVLAVVVARADGEDT